MRPYTEQSGSGRLKGEHDIHHKTYDGGYTHRIATAKAQRHAARRQAKQFIQQELKQLTGDTDE